MRLLRRFLLAVAVLCAAAASCPADEAGALQKGMQAYAEQRFDAAVEHFLSAAEQGEREAQFMLGRMHFEGGNAPPDYVAAYKWFTVALAAGLATAARYRDGLAERMTEAEVAEGARRASEWLEAHPAARGPAAN